MHIVAFIAAGLLTLGSLYLFFPVFNEVSGLGDLPVLLVTPIAQDAMQYLLFALLFLVIGVLLLTLRQQNQQILERNLRHLVESFGNSIVERLQKQLPAAQVAQVAQAGPLARSLESLEQKLDLLLAAQQEEAAPASSQLTPVELAMLYAMLAVMIADGHIDDDEVKHTCNFFHHVTHKEIRPETVRQTASGLLADGHSVDAWLTDLAPQIAPDDRLPVLRAACVIALADGQLVDVEVEQLQTIGRVLGFDTDVVMRTIEACQLPPQ